MLESSSVQPQVSVSGALERVMESSQRVLLARMELLRIEAEEDISRALLGALVVGSGALLLAGGWLAMTALAVYLLRDLFSFALGLTVAAIANGMAGLVLVYYGVRSLRRIRLMQPDDGERKAS